MKKRINIDECYSNRNDGGGIPIWEHEGELFTGILIGYYNSGTICFEQECENGFEEGWVRYYYENGQLEKEYKKVNNILVSGSFKSYDENGNVTGQM